ncbi:beta-defensin 1-like [Sceloporus undulatus]|uniref:beta-defensin 1-like n=1 Tax=Sceloporus undulatus TaxID=8520 RepID=UPI001C4B42ED|nr:beta-defensin 1-like [Sceloporus undulatus]
MYLLHLQFPILLFLILASPGSAKTTHSDLECQQQEGLCFSRRCRRPWRSIGTCNVAWHHCCKRGEHLPPMTPIKEGYRIY